MRKLRVFVGHPFSDSPALRRAQNRHICENLDSKGLLPISPLELFSFYKDDGDVRGDILKFTKDLISICDVFFFYKYPLIGKDEPQLSEGQKDELEEAQKYVEQNHANIRFFLHIKQPPSYCIQLQENVDRNFKV